MTPEAEKIERLRDIEEAAHGLADTVMEQETRLRKMTADNGALRGVLRWCRELAIHKRDLAAEAGNGRDAMDWGRVVRQVDTAFSVTSPETE